MPRSIRARASRRSSARRRSCTASCRAPSVAALRRRDAEARRPRPRLQAPLPAPVLGRPAQPHRHRPRARRIAGVPGLRRGDRRARRVHPGADHQPVHGPARGLRPHLPLHQPRPRRRAAHLRPHPHHVSGPHRRGGADARSCSRRPTTPTPGRCWRRCRASRSSKRTFHPIKGEIPSPLDPPRGCHFHPRCQQAMPRCRTEAPALRTIAPGRTSACHLNDA